MIYGLFGFLLLWIIGIPIIWYKDWQWDNIYLGRKMLVWDSGFKKYMYLGEADNYGMLFYDGTNRIMFYMRGLWHCYKHVEDTAILLHLRACYHYGAWNWKNTYISWCGLAGDLNPKTDLREAIKAAKRYYDNTPEYKISSTGEKYRNSDYYPQARDVCSAFLTIRNYCRDGNIKWATYWSDKDFEDYYRNPKLK